MEPIKTTNGRQPIHAAVQKVWLAESTTSLVFIGITLSSLEYLARRVNEASIRIPIFGPLFFVVMLIWTVSMLKRRWRSWSYEVTDFEVILRWGVWNQVQRFVPRDRIQHADITSGPIARKLGLVHFHLYVAGAHGAVGAIPGLTPEEAEDLRQMLVDSQADHV